MIKYSKTFLHAFTLMLKLVLFKVKINRYSYKYIFTQTYDVVERENRVNHAFIRILIEIKADSNEKNKKTKQISSSCRFNHSTVK